jgi:hypothetical protein
MTRRFSAVSVLVLGLGAGIAQALTFTVISTADSGVGTLRNAIILANTTPGADTIAFNISGAGVHTITPLTALPAITEAVTIDGYTQPGASANTLANGDNAKLMIELDGSAPGLGNVSGLTINADNCTVRGVVINRFQQNGIDINSDDNVITGNFIGTNAAGTAALGNTGQGVFVDGIGNTVGGTTPASRNIISGNGLGVQLNASGNSLQGNFIGTDVTGTIALANANEGVTINGATSNIIGGLTAITGTPPGNLISGNIGIGLDLLAGSDSNQIKGNIIGAAIDGTHALGNSLDGISIVGNGNAIGGTTAGEGNIIAFNGTTSESGVFLPNGSSIINSILGNSIFGNKALGIDLQAPGEPPGTPTLNDTGDNDTGVNNLQNFPVLETVSNSGGMTTITGRLNSAASTTYRIEFFANDAIDPTGYGQGQTLLGFKNVTTDGSGNISFNASFPQIATNQYVTATATDPSGSTSEFSAAIGQLVNISTRLKVLTGNSVLIGGFIIGGTGANKELLVRGLGPTLSQFGVAGALADPTLELHNSAGGVIASNDNWKDTQQAAIMATGLAPPKDLESAILETLATGNYTAILRGKNNTTGVGLVEVYDIDKAFDTTLTNISTRGFVNVGQNVMIGGFISGNGLVRVIVRALGPTLTQFGVPNVLADPTLEIHDANGATIASNDNWADTQQAEIQASGFAPPNAKESAIILVRPPGNTTAIVAGKNNTTGNALVEVYILPP